MCAASEGVVCREALEHGAPAEVGCGVAEGVRRGGETPMVVLARAEGGRAARRRRRWEGVRRAEASVEEWRSGGEGG